jgi:coproporphyrinogen III oxidase-like Fe-S oxidoreductase
VFSSVTRDFYLGLGPGAGTYTGREFHFNVFSVDHYARCLEAGRLPIALRMDVSERMARLFWLYWRLYETEVPLGAWRGSAAGAAVLSKAAEWTGFAERSRNGRLRLTRRGAHWLHTLQNHFALDYVNKIWSACHETPWPERVPL